MNGSAGASAHCLGATGASEPPMAAQAGSALAHWFSDPAAPLQPCAVRRNAIGAGWTVRPHPFDLSRRFGPPPGPMRRL